MTRVKLIWILLIIPLVIALSNCGGQRYIAGRQFLLDGRSESPGYGLYSYILFSKAPSEHTREAYISVIESYLSSIQKIEELQKYIRRDSLNIVYLPLKVDTQIEFNNLDTRQQAQWLLDNYDYARATVYLAKFPENLSNGPYLVSHTKPLSRVSSVSSEYIVQDMGNVHHRVVSLWVESFLEQTAKAEFWDGEHLSRFAHELRNVIAIAADGLGVVADSISWWRVKLGEWIVQK